MNFIYVSPRNVYIYSNIYGFSSTYVAIFFTCKYKKLTKLLCNKDYKNKSKKKQEKLT